MIHSAGAAERPSLISWRTEPEVSIRMFILETFVVVLSVVAFVLFDVYAHACDRI